MIVALVLRVLRVRRARAAVLALWLAFAWAQPATAHVPSQEQWHPLAAAHLFALFAASLEPVDWESVAERYATVPRRAAAPGEDSAYALLARLTSQGADPGAPIRAAIAARDATALRTATTAAASAAVRAHLERAKQRIDQPRAALQEAVVARSVYRSLDIALKADDPKTHRRLGLTWLGLTTALVSGTADAKARIEDLSGELIRRFETGAPQPKLARIEGWLPPDANIVEQTSLPRLVLNFEERGIDERKLFLVAYGDMLFDSPLIFGEPARSLNLSCARCHNRGDVNRDLYIPGVSRRHGGLDVDSQFFNPQANDMRFDPIDTPSLRGIRFTGPYGRDGRMASLREFTRAVIVQEFAGAEPTPLMLDALVAYLNEFDFLPNPLLYRDGRLNAEASPAAKRGEAIFNRPYASMGGRACAGCHIPDGNFVDGRRHDIGSASTASAHSRDGAFDTPTLLGIKYTAPYFHDGSLPDLTAVVDWFNRRYALGLDAGEQSDLAAYLDAVGSGEEPFEQFAGRHTRFRLAFEEVSVFLSTLDTLIPARDQGHTVLMLQSVAAELRAETYRMVNVPALDKVEDLIRRIDAMAVAAEAGNWAGLAGLWRDYQAQEARVAAQIY